MRFFSFCTMFLFLSTLVALAAPPAAPNEPQQLLKPVVPPTASIRVRIPLIEASGTTMHFKAQIPRGKPKKGEKTPEKAEMVDIEVGMENMPGKSYVSAKLWESWGYEVPPNKVVALPDLTVQAAQIAPKLTAAKSTTAKAPPKGYDVQVKFPGIALDVVDPPGGAEKVMRCDIYIRLPDLTRGADRTFEPRLYFQDKFLELTVPSTAVKRLGTGDEPPGDPSITTDPELAVITSPMINKQGSQIFSYAAVNGFTQYKTAEGKVVPVTVMVSSTTDFPTGVFLTMGTARGCMVSMEQEKDEKATGVTFETRTVKGKFKELRLGVMTGPGLKTQKDIVIQDLTVYVDKANSDHYVYLGPRFMETYLKDSIYACGSDGIFSLNGRAKPDLLQDIKTRPKK